MDFCAVRIRAIASDANASDKCAIALVSDGLLRLRDNSSLISAAQTGLPVVPVYVFDPRPYERAAGAIRALPRIREDLEGMLLDHFEHQRRAVSSLQRGLRERGSDLVVAVGPARDVVPRMLASSSSCAVASVHITPGLPADDTLERARAASKASGVALNISEPPTLLDPADYPQLREPPASFLDFKQSLLRPRASFGAEGRSRRAVRLFVRAPAAAPNFGPLPGPDVIARLALDAGRGEEGPFALDLEAAPELENDALAALRGASLDWRLHLAAWRHPLSTALRLGSVSAREAYRELGMGAWVEGPAGGRGGRGMWAPYSLLSELLFRDFLLAHAARGSLPKRYRPLLSAALPHPKVVTPRAPRHAPDGGEALDASYSDEIGRHERAAAVDDAEQCAPGAATSTNPALGQPHAEARYALAYVDGNNLLHCVGCLRRLVFLGHAAEAEAALAGALRGHRGGRAPVLGIAGAVRLVFDRRVPPPPRVPATAPALAPGSLQVSFAQPEHRTTDELFTAIARGGCAPDALFVTSDRRLAAALRARGRPVMPSLDFLALALAGGDPAGVEAAIIAAAAPQPS
eukprot:tig00000842_g4843.t1